MKVYLWLMMMILINQTWANGSDWQHIKAVKKSKEAPQKMEEDPQKKLKQEEKERREKQRQLDRLLEHEARYPQNL